MPTLAANAVSKSEAYKAFLPNQRKDVLDLVTSTVQSLFKVERAPLLPREQLLFQAKLLRLNRLVPITESFTQPFRQNINEVEARQGKSLAEQIAQKKEEVLQKLPAECDLALREKIVALAQQQVEKRFASGYDEQILALKKPLFEGSCQERLDAIIVLAELQCARREFLEDAVNGPPALEFLIEQACGRTPSLDALVAEAKKTADFFSRLLKLLQRPPAVVAASSSSTLEHVEASAMVQPVLYLAARIEAVSAPLAPAAPLPAPLMPALFTQFQQPFSEVTELPEALIGLIGEYHYSINDVLPTVGCDLTRLPPQWAAGRLKQEAQQPDFVVDLRNSDLTFRKLSRIAAECASAPKLQINIENSTFAGRKTTNKAVLAQFFPPHVQVTGATCHITDSSLTKLTPYREDLGLTEEQLWNLEVTLHDEEHSIHPCIHSVNHLAWRAQEHTKLLHTLQNVWKLFFPVQ